MESDSDQSDYDDSQYYYRGRVIRTPQWKNLHKLVLTKLQHTVLLFLTWFYADLQEYLETPGTKIPCKLY